jgi:hypothetical protein
MEFITGIVVPFLSTSVGVFSAFQLERWWRRWEEEQLRLRTQASIAAELQRIAESARTFKLWEQQEQNPTPYIDLSTDAKDSAVSSGRFALLQPELEIRVSEVYTIVEQARAYQARILDALPGLRRQNRRHDLVSNLDNELKRLSGKILPFSQSLKPLQTRWSVVSETFLFDTYCFIG